MSVNDIIFDQILPASNDAELSSGQLRVLNTIFTKFVANRQKKIDFIMKLFPDTSYLIKILKNQPNCISWSHLVIYSCIVHLSLLNDADASNDLIYAILPEVSPNFQSDEKSEEQEKSTADAKLLADITSLSQSQLGCMLIWQHMFPRLSTNKQRKQMIKALKKFISSISINSLSSNLAHIWLALANVLLTLDDTKLAGSLIKQVMLGSFDESNHFCLKDILLKVHQEEKNVSNSRISLAEQNLTGLIKLVVFVFSSSKSLAKKKMDIVEYHHAIIPPSEVVNTVPNYCHNILNDPATEIALIKNSKKPLEKKLEENASSFFAIMMNDLILSENSEIYVAELLNRMEGGWLICELIDFSNGSSDKNKFFDGLTLVYRRILSINSDKISSSLIISSQVARSLKRMCRMYPEIGKWLAEFILEAGKKSILNMLTEYLMQNECKSGDGFFHIVAELIRLNHISEKNIPEILLCMDPNEHTSPGIDAIRKALNVA